MFSRQNFGSDGFFCLFLQIFILNKLYMTPEQEDILAVAEIAGKVKGFYQTYKSDRERLVTDNGTGAIIPKNIMDPRQLITNAFRGQPGMPQIQPQQYYQPPNYQYPQENSLTAYGQQIPQVMPAQAPQLLPVPVGRNPDGTIIMGDAGLLASTQAPQANNNGGLQTTGFQLPQFGNVPPVPNNSGNSISNEDFQILMKELKSMKKSINKLTRAFETAKLIPDEHITVNVQQPVTEEDLENTD
jgi:hypothetical protein